MPAIIYNGVKVIGYNLNPSIEEMDRLGTQYEIVEVIPEIILTLPEGYIVEKQADGFALVEIPIPEPDPDRIQQLETELAAVTLELVDTQIRLNVSESDHANLLLELVDKGVL